MDEEQIEIKDEFLHQHEELLFENDFIAASSIENTNILNEEVHIKDEPSDLLLTTENMNFINSPICPTINEETSEICTKFKTFNESENLEESGIFVKSETDNKAEIIFGINESDSQNIMSTVSNDEPFDIANQMLHTDKGDISERSTDKRLQCDACNSFFKTKTNLKIHIESVHEGKKPFKCNICEINFCTEEHLKYTHCIYY